jgi:glycosyltransferase involved in cell wall biosynthesis
MYCYELASELSKRGHTVAITSNRVGGEITARTRDRGIAVYPLEECRSDWAPDVLHVQELVPSCFAASMYPRVPAVASVHSEFDCERPFLSERIWRYICVRPSVQAVLTDHYGVAPERTVVIHNGFDVARFAQLRDSTHAVSEKEKRVLFVGTVDPVRKRAIQDIIARGAREGFRVRVVGEKYDDYLDSPPTHVEVYPATWDVERHLAEASATAGILLGRTTIEGWLAGLPGWIYDIELDGSIKSRELFAPPRDLSLFDISTVADHIIQLYSGAISSGYIKDLSVSIDSLGVASALSTAELARVSNDLANLWAEISAVRAKTVGLRAIYRGYLRVAEAVRKLRRGMMRLLLWPRV